MVEFFSADIEFRVCRKEGDVELIFMKMLSEKNRLAG